MAQASKNFRSAFVYEAQTLFITAKPVVRYPIAIVLAAIGAYMYSVAKMDISHAAIYFLMAGVYAWEMTAALAVMAVIFGIFKLLALLPLGVAIAVVAVAVLYLGV